MFYLEKLAGETSEQVRIWIEDLLYKLHPKTSRHVSELLERDGFSDWPGIVRVGGEIIFEGKSFCGIWWIALRTFSSLMQMASSGDIIRDVITVGSRVDYEAEARLGAKLSRGSWDESEELPPTRIVAELYRNGVKTEIDPTRIDPPFEDHT